MASTNFDYDQNGHQVRLDDHDRSKNAPQALTGYPIDLRPQTDWPGATGATAGQFQVQTDAARDVAAWLQQQASLLQDVPARLKAGTHAVHYGPPVWAEATHLATAADQVSTAIADYGHEMITNLGLAAQAITTAINAYEGKDTSARASADTLNTQIPTDTPYPPRTGRHAADSPPPL
jgi:hypothetical protein